MVDRGDISKYMSANRNMFMLFR